MGGKLGTNFGESLSVLAVKKSNRWTDLLFRFTELCCEMDVDTIRRIEHGSSSRAESIQCKQSKRPRPVIRSSKTIWMVFGSYFEASTQKQALPGIPSNKNKITPYQDLNNPVWMHRSSYFSTIGQVSAEA